MRTNWHSWWASQLSGRRQRSLPISCSICELILATQRLDFFYHYFGSRYPKLKDIVFSSLVRSVSYRYMHLLKKKKTRTNQRTNSVVLEN